MKKEQAKNAIAKLLQCIDRDTCENNNCIYYATSSDVTDILAYINDSEEIVRCADCKWFIKTSDWDKCALDSGRCDISEDFYCVNGEKL